MTLLFVIFVAAIGIAVLSIFSFLGFDVTQEQKERLFVRLPEDLGVVELWYDRSDVGLFDDANRKITIWNQDKKQITVNLGVNWGPVNTVSVWIFDRRTILIADCVNASIVDLELMKVRGLSEGQDSTARLHVGSFISGHSKGVFVTAEEPMTPERLSKSC